jgi:hypothetical protein
MLIDGIAVIPDLSTYMSGGQANFIDDFFSMTCANILSSEMYNGFILVQLPRYMEHPVLLNPYSPNGKVDAACLP